MCAYNFLFVELFLPNVGGVAVDQLLFRHPSGDIDNQSGKSERCHGECLLYVTLDSI